MKRQVNLQSARRDFLATSACGIGGVALSSLLLEDGLLGAEFSNPMAPRKPHFDAKAKACINIFMAGAPSQIDLFDPKPVLAKRHGQKLPKEILDKARFAFIKPATALAKSRGICPFSKATATKSKATMPTSKTLAVAPAAHSQQAPFSKPTSMDTLGLTSTSQAPPGTTPQDPTPP